ncbi:GATA transcription factor 21 [Benincasa hispida]|uniref:GATA transcription factor 21 n=1 Tax=Benincasa hispida TaxID=102211 RepID=UPI001901CF6C|nr:GATA transcription factor 21 [Benincasa hispida]
MAPPYRDSFPSDHDDLDLRYSSSHHLFFPITPQPSSSSSSSLSFPILDHSDDPRSIELKHEGGGIMACNNDQIIGNNHEDDVETGLRFTIWKQIDKRESSSCCENNNNNNTHNDLVKWSSSSSSSKIKFLINSNQTETATRTIDSGRNFQDLNQTSPTPSPSSFDQTNKRTSTALQDGGAIIRTCSDCNTTKTPLWRSGPRGPKSLCNACGIRQRKARRAMAEAAAAAANGEKPAAVVLKSNKAVQHKIMTKSAVATTTTTLKRKCKDAVVQGEGGGGDSGGGRKNLCFEEIKIGRRLSEISSSYQRVFPQDEREAAILLMTLSYGLLHG